LDILYRKQTETNKSFYIKKDSNYEKIYQKYILYLKASGNTTEIHTRNKSVYNVSTNLADLLIKLDNDSIVKVNRSYAVNINYIIKFNYNKIYIEKKDAVEEIKLTDTFRAKLMKKLKIIKTK